VAGHKAVRAVRQLGTVAAVELAGTAGYLSDVGRAMSAFALQEGVLLRPLGNVVYVLPPYCITLPELARAHDVIARFLDGERAKDERGGDVD
jgi:adenosylmethionine-8-amino-7-oxononanoate aminotransferase